MTNFKITEQEISYRGQTLDPSFVIEHFLPLVTKERKEKIERLLPHRTHHFIPILENIYDQGNINAVMRTCENFGLYEIHSIASERIKTKTTRITKGADKWVVTHQHPNINQCLKGLKSRGYQVGVTAMNATSLPFTNIDFSKPTAIIIGNEKEGCSEEAMKESDFHCVIPTVGVTQSFNLSVAAGIILSYAFQQIQEISQAQKSLYLNERQQEFLKAVYLLRSVGRYPYILNELLSL